MKGDAEAFAITARATAEAERMNLKAEALREYKKAAKVALWTEALPSMAAEVSAPLSQCDKVRGGRSSYKVGTVGKLAFNDKKNG